jgi:hypothetical protein
VSTTSSREGQQQQADNRSNGSSDGEAVEFGQSNTEFDQPDAEFSESDMEFGQSDAEFDPSATKVDLMKAVVDAEPEPEIPAAQQPTPADPPWATAAEPEGSVFADRGPAASFGPPDTFSPAPPPPLTTGPINDKPVASAAGSSLGARLGRQPSDGKTARKAHLQVSRFEPWSVMKFSFIMSLVCFVMLFVAVTVIYMVLSGLGVFDSIVNAINDTTRSQNATDSGTDAASWFSASRILGYTAMIGALNVLLITALSTVGSVIYNLAADFVGGVEVTLKEAE